MNVELHERTEHHVRVYFEKTQNAEIQKYLPQTVTSIQHALDNYAKTQKPDATSYGCTIYVDGDYVGDIWCYAMDPKEMPQAMVSYCIFDRNYWGKGVMTQALGLFLAEIKSRFGISSIGAFSFSQNTASVRVLEKNGFSVQDTFLEEGVESVYLATGEP